MFSLFPEPSKHSTQAFETQNKNGMSLQNIERFCKMGMKMDFFDGKFL
jgi:hypothetical protein